MRTMKTTQTYIASELGVSVQYVNSLVVTKKRPNWKRAKQLAKITGTDPVLWLEGSSDDIRSALDSNNKTNRKQNQSKKNEAV